MAECTDVSNTELKHGTSGSWRNRHLGPISMSGDGPAEVEVRLSGTNAEENLEPISTGCAAEAVAISIRIKTPHFNAVNGAPAPTLQP